MRKYGICYFSCKDGMEFFKFIAIDKPTLISFDLRQSSGAVLFGYDGEDDRKSGRIVLLDLIGLVTSSDLTGLVESLKKMSEFRNCVYRTCD